MKKNAISTSKVAGALLASLMLALAGCQPKTDAPAATASAASEAAAPAAMVPTSEAAPSAADSDKAGASGATASAKSDSAADDGDKAEKSEKASDGPVTHFKAYGFSPAWQAEIKGDVLEFDVPDTTGVDEPLRKINVERSAYAKGVNYDGKDGKVAVTVDIKSGPCDIATEGTPREFFATLTYGKKTYRGCADAAR